MTDAFAPIPRQGRPASVARQLQDAILAGDLQPGERLPPLAALAARLGVSVPVLREAVAALDAVGLVEARQGAGTFVRDRPPPTPALAGWLGFGSDPDERRGLADARKVVETALAALAAERAGPDAAGELDAAATALRRAVGDAGAFAQADLDFHLAVARHAGSPVLARVLHALGTVLLAQLRENAVAAGRQGRSDSAARHRELAGAVCAGDPDRAAALMTELVG